MTPVASRTVAFVGEEAKKLLAKLLVYAMIAGALLWVTPVWERATAIWDSPAVLDEIQVDLRFLRAEIAVATGEDRIIRQPSGTSYVVEPVVRGDAVVMHLVLGRTTLGESCRFVGGVSLFTDLAGITVAGSEVRVQRQIGASPARIRVDLQHPSSLLAGRVEVYLALEYICNGDTRFDRTDTLAFLLVERESD